MVKYVKLICNANTRFFDIRDGVYYFGMRHVSGNVVVLVDRKDSGMFGSLAVQIEEIARVFSDQNQPVAARVVEMNGVLRLGDAGFFWKSD